jgi:tetratricopeptide (TPR) repeat protein
MQIQVNAPGFRDRETTTCSLEDPHSKSTININSNSNSNGKNTISSSSQRPRPRINNTISTTSAADYSTSFEANKKGDLEWLVKTTSDLLGPESPPLGSMSPQTVHRTSLLMTSWARRAGKKESKAPHLVERLLKRLLHERDAGNENVLINTSTYNILLDAWSRSPADGSAERCEEILVQMERMHDQGKGDVEPDQASYNAVIKAYVKAGSKLLAAPKAEAIIERMERKVSPTRRSYNLLLYAWANASIEDAAARAQQVLRRMQEQYKEGNVLAKPDTNSYNQVLAAWSRGRKMGFERRMQFIFDELMALPEEEEIHPDTDTFNHVMGGWLKSDDKDALTRIEETFKLMEQNYEMGNKEARPDRITINTITAAYARSPTAGEVEKSMELRSSMEERYGIKPDVVSHNILVDSWCKSGRPDAPDRVVELLNTMEREFKRGIFYLKPDAYTYSSVIDCFIKCDQPGAVERAERILERMEELHRDHGGDPVPAAVYNTIMNAWASSNSEEAPARVKALLLEMEENGPQPNRITYNTVIKAMRDGTAHQAAYAEQVLFKLEERGVSENEFLPDSYSYTSVITAYARSDAWDKAQKALQLLERMIQAYKNGNIACKPTVHSFNAALNACAFTQGDEGLKAKAFSICMTIYDLLKKNSDADHTSYGTILRCCGTLLSPRDKTRQEMVEYMFQKACEQGQVGRLVVNQMKFAAQPHQHMRLTGLDLMERVNMRDLPRAWTRNVKENNRRPRPSPA